jgi:hypothetical protein
MGRIAASTDFVIGLLSIFYFSSTTSGKRHPSFEDRLTIALEFLNLEDHNICWRMACVGFELWDNQFGLQMDWLECPQSQKQQSYHLIQQIKARN